MKKNKLGLLLSVVPLLIGCGNQSYAGVYGFQLGKEAGTHFGAFLTLKDDAYTTEPGMKQFELSISIKTGSQEDEGVFTNLLTILDDGTGKKVLPGYYSVTNAENKKLQGKEMKIGLDFVYIVDKVKAFYREITGEDITFDDQDLKDLNNSALIQGLLDASYAGNVVNFFIPVSLEDALLQLYWYGVDIRINILADDPIQVFDTTPHERGTEPTDADIASIKDQFATDHKDCLVPEFRVFHRVKLGLTKV